MRELSLFSGAGGGLLASKYFLGWETIGYVEYEEYCQKVLKQRIADGLLDAAPIFGDIRAFISEGYAEQYRGMVDVITAGFPCQPFSSAGKGLGEDDPRNMWPQTLKCINIIQPSFAFLENVPNLLTHGYIRRIFGDLAESGYNARWRVLSAAEMGAPHLRDRLWIFLSNTKYSARSAQQKREHKRAKKSIGSRKDKLEARNEMADTEGNPKRPGLCENEQREVRGRRSGNSDSTPRIWSTEPNVGRVANGVPSRVDRLKAIGNGQVPQCMARAWELLTENTN